MRPTVCTECAAPMSIIAAQSYADTSWVVGLVCPMPHCPGVALYNSLGKMVARGTIAGLRDLVAKVNDIQKRKRERGVHLDRKGAGPKPTLCIECRAPMWIVGAHRWVDGRWEVGLVCPARACPGWGVYGSVGKLGTHRSKQLHPSLSRAQDAVGRALKHKEATAAQDDKPQVDTWAARER